MIKAREIMQGGSLLAAGDIPGVVNCGPALGNNVLDALFEVKPAAFLRIEPGRWAVKTLQHHMEQLPCTT